MSCHGWFYALTTVYHQCAWEQTGDLFIGAQWDWENSGGFLTDEVNCCGRELNVYSTIGSPYYHLLDVSDTNQIMIQTGGTDHGYTVIGNWCGIFRVDDISYEGWADTNGSL